MYSKGNDLSLSYDLCSVGLTAASLQRMSKILAHEYSQPTSLGVGYCSCFFFNSSFERVKAKLSRVRPTHFYTPVSTVSSLYVSSSASLGRLSPLLMVLFLLYCLTFSLNYAANVIYESFCLFLHFTSTPDNHTT